MTCERIAPSANQRTRHSLLIKLTVGPLQLWFHRRCCLTLAQMLNQSERPKLRPFLPAQRLTPGWYLKNFLGNGPTGTAIPRMATERYNTMAIFASTSGGEWSRVVQNLVPTWPHGAEHV